MNEIWFLLIWNFSIKSLTSQAICRYVSNDVYLYPKWQGKEISFPSYGMYLAEIKRKESFSEMLIETKFLDKKKEWNYIISPILH